MNKIITLLVLYYFSILSTQAQYYVNNINLSGIEYSQGLTGCEVASEELANELPLNYADSFKVFSFGFYLHSDKFENSESRMLELVLSSVQSQVPYYLVIIRIMNEISTIDKIRVLTNLPVGDSLHCLIVNQFILLSANVANIINSEFQKSGKTNFDYLNAEIEGIKYTEKYIVDK